MALPTAAAVAALIAADIEEQITAPSIESQITGQAASVQSALRGALLSDAAIAARSAANVQVYTIIMTRVLAAIAAAQVNPGTLEAGGDPVTGLGTIS